MLHSLPLESIIVRSTCNCLLILKFKLQLPNQQNLVQRKKKRRNGISGTATATHLATVDYEHSLRRLSPLTIHATCTNMPLEAMHCGKAFYGMQRPEMSKVHAWWRQHKFYTFTSLLTSIIMVFSSPTSLALILKIFFEFLGNLTRATLESVFVPVCFVNFFFGTFPFDPLSWMNTCRSIN